MRIEKIDLPLSRQEQLEQLAGGANPTAPVMPEQLTEEGNKLWQLYCSLEGPLQITEDGICDADGVEIDHYEMLVVLVNAVPGLLCSNAALRRENAELKRELGKTREAYEDVLLEVATTEEVN